jgi:putative ABC transport system substrate-binding protein
LTQRRWSYDEEFTAKRLQLLKEIAPNLSRVLIIGSRSNPAWIEIFSKYNELANRFQLRFTTFDTENNDEFERVAQSFAQDSDGGIDVSPSIYTWVNREAIIAIAARSKLPAVYTCRAFVMSGCLIAYSFDGLEQWRGRPPTLIGSLEAKSRVIYRFNSPRNFKRRSISGPPKS